MLKHIDLCSGIGGFALGFEWAGLSRPVMFCDIEPWSRKILAKHWPDVPIEEDVKVLANEPEKIPAGGRDTILTAGYPCQPFSNSGKRRGTEDDRAIWPYIREIVAHKRPSWCVFENVYGHVSMGLDEVLSDLEADGYATRPFIVPAASVDASHRRDRVWIIANRERLRLEHTEKSGSVEERERKTRLNVAESIETNGERGNAPDTDSTTRKGERINRQGKRKPIGRSSFTIQDRWEEFPTVPPICGGDDGLPKELDGITFPKWRRESIKAYGNAIVPQVAYRIFEAIQEYEKRKKSPPPREELPSHHGE